jgi:hypothetical protein
MARRSESDAVFVDTSYILALVNPDDPDHLKARLMAEKLAHGRTPRITSEAILIEIGNSLSRGRRRKLGVQVIQLLRNDSKLIIVPVDSPLLDRAFDLYRSLMDKDWGLTDCISFVIMHERGVKRALTLDSHFSQVGFKCLL